MKVTVVGAGAVGASCAEYIAIKNFASEVVLVDIKPNFAEGKAMDLMQTASLNGFDTQIIGSTNDYSKTAGSDIAVITSVIPRKPGMTREELIGINAGIVQSVAKEIVNTSPNVILIIVSNPILDSGVTDTGQVTFQVKLAINFTFDGKDKSVDDVSDWIDEHLEDLYLYAWISPHATI